MNDRFVLLFARDAKKSLAELQPKQFKQIATNNTPDNFDSGEGAVG